MFNSLAKYAREKLGMKATHVNAAGITYYLHTRRSPQGTPLYFFSRTAEGALPNMPEGRAIGGELKNGVPYLKKV